MSKQKMNKVSFIYKTKEGDTIEALSKKFKITREEMEKANPDMKYDNDKLKPEQKIVLPSVSPGYYWRNNFPTVRYGDRGHAVAAAQTVLSRLGYTLQVDGIFGPKTLNAVKIYQGYANLAQDGIVGPNTWGNMQERWLKHYYSDTPYEYYTINYVQMNTFRYQVNTQRWEVWYNPGTLGWYPIQ